MRKHTLACSVLSFVLLLGAMQHPSIVTAGAFDWSALPVEESFSFTDADAADTQIAQAPEKKNGNGVVRILSAPFRAIGRLFGGSKKSDQKSDSQARRSTEKETPKFESTKVIRITDARTPLETPADTTALVSDKPFDNYLRRGRELLVNGDVNGAITELSRAVSLDSKSGEARNLLGVAYEALGMRDRALEMFKAAVQADKNNADYLNNYGFLLFKNNDFEEATKYLKRAAKLSPDNPRVWNNLGLAQCRRGKFDDAFESFTHAVGEFNGHLNIASQLLAHGYAKDAIKHLEIAQRMQPNSTEVLAKLVQLYQTTGRISDAETARRSIIALQTAADAKK